MASTSLRRGVTIDVCVKHFSTKSRLGSDSRPMGPWAPGCHILAQPVQAVYHFGRTWPSRLRSQHGAWSSASRCCDLGGWRQPFRGQFSGFSWIFPLQVFPLQTTSCSFWLIRKQVAAMFVVVFGSIQTRPKSSNPKVGTSTFHGACKFQPQLCWTLPWTLCTRPALTVEDKPRSTCSWLGCQDVLLGPRVRRQTDFWKLTLKAWTWPHPTLWKWVTL